jgi:hypothetical protein
MKETWIENRIDPKVFRDDDGRLYMYMVKFTDGNTIWVRSVNKDGGTFLSSPLYQFASLPGTWETMDNRVAEGPWVIKYRNRYYMMYNANHTATAWGNYQLGVSEAESPVMFNHGNKYPYPLLLSNQTHIEDTYTDLLLFDEGGYNPYFSYTTDEPENDWKEISYENSWLKGRTGFASREIKGSSARKFGTSWDSDKLFVQKKFNCNQEPGNLALRIHHDGETRVYLNEKLVYEKPGADYGIINLDVNSEKWLKGENRLAIETNRGTNGNYLDVSLFDMKNDKADDILFSPGQPNILRGPNGFEWWLIYMANKNKEHRGQYINRIHFFDKVMYSDGVTGENTEGYFPGPAKPTCAEMLYPGQPGTQTLIDDKHAGVYYLFEAGIKTSDEAGIIAWWKDRENWIRVGLDKKNFCWYVESFSNGVKKSDKKPRFPDFSFNLYNSLRIERNADVFQVSIDDLRAPGNFSFGIPEVKEKGVPGLFTEKGTSAFEGITYTLGWDEFDDQINAWDNYKVSVDGIRPLSAGKEETLKGDFLSRYEYTLQVTNSENKGMAGVYPLYIDENNYVKAVFNYDTNTMDITGIKKGKVVYDERFSLENLKTHYADMKYTDFIEKVYYFRTPTLLNEIQLKKIPVDHDTLFINNMFEYLTTEYLYNEKWTPLSEPVSNASNLLYNSMKFPSVKAEALRFMNKKATDKNRYIYKIKVNEVFKDSYNLRSVKLEDRIIIIVEGKQLCSINQAYPAAQVGLCSEGCMPCYNGILRYHIPE